MSRDLISGGDQHAIGLVNVAGEGDLDIPNSITDGFEFEGGVKVVAIVSPPSASETYVGYAPVKVA